MESEKEGKVRAWLWLAVMLAWDFPLGAAVPGTASDLPPEGVPVWVPLGIFALLMAGGVVLLWKRSRVLTRAYGEALRELDALDRNLAGARLEAEEARATSAWLMEGWSHGLCMPLRGLAGMTASLLQGVGGSTGQRLLAARAQASASRILESMERLQALAQGDSPESTWAPFDLLSELEAVLAQVADAAHGKGVEIAGHFLGLPELVEGDPVLLRHLLLHMLADAIQRADQGTITLKVWVVAQEHGSLRIRFEVLSAGQTAASGGKGDQASSAEVPAAACTPSPCETLAESLGGAMGQELRGDGNMLAWCELPWVSQGGSRGPMGLPEGFRVLVVEADPASRGALRETFKAWDVDAICLESFQELERRLSSPLVFDVLLAVLPVGAQVLPEGLASLVERLGKGSVPMLAALGLGSMGLAEELGALGFQDVLAKPIQRAALQEALQRMVELPHVPCKEPLLDPHTWKGLAYLEEISGPGAIADVVASYVKDAPLRLEGMKAAFAAGDIQGLGKLAHDLKSNSGTVGAKALAHVGELIEHGAYGEFELDYEACLREAEVLLAAVLEALAERIPEVK